MPPLAKMAQQGPLRILVIGDPHVRTSDSPKARKRWRALARFAIRNRPDVIVWIGDHWDMTCLPQTAKSRGGPGRKANVRKTTFLQDIQAGRDAIVDFQDEIDRYNRRSSRSGRKWAVFKPRKVFCLGNHEMRVDESGGTIEEYVDLINVKTWITDWLAARGFEVVPFLETIELGGVFFVHYHKSGLMGRAVPMTQAIAKIGRSSVWGHSHTMAYLERAVPASTGGGWDKFLCLPTFKDPDFLDIGETSGVVLLDDVWAGNFTFSMISTDRLIASYDGPFDRPFE